jgi:hypothetical protein
MLILTAWLTLMGAGGLCYPRRPRATGVLFVVAGGFLWAAGDSMLVLSALSAALGLGKLWQFRDPVARAAHIVGWIGKG